MTLIDTTLYAKASKELEKLVLVELAQPDNHAAFAAIMSSGEVRGYRTPNLIKECSFVQ